MLALFGLGFALAASPGPDFVLITRHAVAHGRSIGYATLLGNRVSLCLHISLAIAGVSVIVQRSPTLFAVLRVVGAMYLLYLGSVAIGRGRHRRQQPATNEKASIARRVAFREGFLNNLLNPKVSLFFLSLFSQLASQQIVERTPWTAGAVFFAGNTSWWVPLVAVVGTRQFRNPLLRLQWALDILFGALFICFGVWSIGELLRSRY